MKIEVEKVQVIVQACGDYVAFHEMSVRAVYAFGAYFMCDDDNIAEIACNTFKCDYNDLVKQDKKVLDGIAKTWYENQESGDYCDTEIQTALCTISNGQIDQTYIGA